MAKAKLKTHRGAAKRFKVTGAGRVKRRRAYRNHILTKMSSKRKRHLRVAASPLTSSDSKLIKRMLQGS